MSFRYPLRAARVAAFGFIALLVSAPAFAACGAAPTAATTDSLLRLNATGAWSGAVEDAGSAVAGDFVYDGTNNVPAFCNGTAWVDVAAAGGNTTLNGIMAATANQAGIANAAYTIKWNWDTLTTGTALTIASASLTTGTLLYLNNANSAAGGGAVLDAESSAASGGLDTIYASTASTTGRAAFFESSATTGVNYGVIGRTHSTSANANGVYGIALGATGATFGVYGETDSTTAAASGVYGTANGASGATYGVYGTNVSATGYGGYFTNSNGGYALATGSGTVQLGSAGTAFTSMGVCTVASYTPTNSFVTDTCTGVPASTSVAVNCSPVGALSSASDTINARANGTLNQIIVNISAANTNAVSLVCMWVKP